MEHDFATTPFARECHLDLSPSAKTRAHPNAYDSSDDRSFSRFRSRADRSGIFQQPPITDPNWTKPFDPFRIVGNFYYVGGYDLACFLITTTDGNILVNTGLDASVSMIRANIESLGFKFADTKMLLATHAHFDHVAAMAELKRLTGARMLMNEADAQTLEDGGDTDYRYPDGRGAVFEPVKVDQRLKDGDKIRLGSTELTVYHHPGHTKGSTSFAFTTQDGARSYRVLIANMDSVNQGVRLLDSPAYPASSKTMR